MQRNKVKHDTLKTQRNTKLLGFFLPQKEKTVFSFKKLVKSPKTEIQTEN